MKTYSNSLVILNEKIGNKQVIATNAKSNQMICMC